MPRRGLRALVTVGAELDRTRTVGRKAGVAGDLSVGYAYARRDDAARYARAPPRGRHRVVAKASTSARATCARMRRTRTPYMRTAHTRRKV